MSDIYTLTIEQPDSSDDMRTVIVDALAVIAKPLAAGLGTQGTVRLELNGEDISNQV